MNGQGGFPNPAFLIQDGENHGVLIASFVCMQLSVYPFICFCVYMFLCLYVFVFVVACKAAMFSVPGHTRPAGCYHAPHGCSPRPPDRAARVRPDRQLERGPPGRLTAATIAGRTVPSGARATGVG